jgi:hypothetical protein
MGRSALSARVRGSPEKGNCGGRPCRKNSVIHKHGTGLKILRRHSNPSKNLLGRCQTRPQFAPNLALLKQTCANICID